MRPRVLRSLIPTLAIIGLSLFAARPSNPAPLSRAELAKAELARAELEKKAELVKPREIAAPLPRSQTAPPGPQELATAPNASSAAASAPAAATKPPKRRLLRREVTRAIAQQARRIIDAHHTEPFGTEIPFETDGQPYIARIEQHYHPPGGDKRPWGHHAGVSVFVERNWP